MRITFLGTGTSHGVPSLDCMRQDYQRCRKGVCKAAQSDPKHVRTRCSILLESKKGTVLLDVSMDFRQQALREKIMRIDAVLVTHRHMDHMGGIPDLRSYTEEPLPLYGSQETLEEAQRAFSYAFDPDAYVGGGITRLIPHVADRPFELLGFDIVPIPVEHGVLRGCVGWRIGQLAYLPDIKSLPAESLKLLRGVDWLVLDCLRDERPHPTHLILSESIELCHEVAPRRCWFVHMSHDIHYESDAARLEPGMEFAYDGLKVNIDDKRRMCTEETDGTI